MKSAYRNYLSIHSFLIVFQCVLRERDEQLEFVRQCKNKIRELEQREEEAYQQIKKGIELVEQAQLEQTEVLYRVIYPLLNALRRTNLRLEISLLVTAFHL